MSIYCEEIMVSSWYASVLEALADEDRVRLDQLLANADGELLNDPDHSHSIPLTEAVKHGHYGIVQKLLHAGADVDALD